MDENFILNENYTVSPMSDQHSTATISEKVVDVSNIGTFVMGEHNSSMITFQIDRYYDGVDLSDKKIKIVYKNSNGIYKSDDAEICNVKYSQKSLRFSWVVSNNVTQTTKFIAYICFISEDYLLKTENFTVQVKSSFDPSTSEPSANWFVTIEGKLEKIEKDIANNHVYDWAKQPEKPTYTPEEIGAEKAGTSDGIFRSSMKYTDGEISRLENTVIPNNVANIEQKITDINQSVVNLQDVKAEKVHTHLVTDITDFPTSLPASDVHDWAKAEVKPTYTHEEVGALSSSTHIPSTLEEMTDDQNHRTVSDVEKETWNNKSEFSGEYSDLKNIPEIKQLTDELKAKYDAASDMATKNQSDITTKLNKSGYTAHQWLQTDENGNIVAGEKPTYTSSEVSALPDTTHIPSTLAEMTEDDEHKTITSAERENWNAKSDFSGDYSELSNKPKIPEKLADLAEDETHRTVTDSEKGAWDAKSNFSGNYSDLSGVPAIPEKLPNPNKLTFSGAVTAEYDGSGAVTVEIPEENDYRVARIEKGTTDSTVELEPNKLYIFPEMGSLTYTLAVPNDSAVANEYHFVFKSGATATRVVHPAGVNIGSFSVESNKIYEVSILEGLLTSQSWAVN